jgi:hypothetical protein
MSAAEIASRGAAESAADKAYQEQLLDSAAARAGPRGGRQVRVPGSVWGERAEGACLLRC